MGEGVDDVFDASVEVLAEEVAFAEWVEALCGGFDVGAEAVEEEGVGGEGAAELSDEGGSSLVETVGESETGGEPADAGLVVGAELGEALVSGGGQGFAVVTG